MKRSLLVLVPVFLVALTAGSMPRVFAAGSISLSAAGSVVKGSIVSVNIYENSDAEPVNAASATINYPTNLLTYVSISNSSAFGIVAANSAGGGQVKVDRGALPAVSGRQLIASVQFKANTDSGSAAISVASGSVLSANSNAELFSGGSGVSIALKAPVVAPPPPPADTTAPIISNVKSSITGTNKATVTWTTSEPATSKLDYGFTTNYGIVVSDPNLVTSHSLVLNPDLLSPLTTVHYMVSGADGAGNNAKGVDQTLTTQGLNVLVTVLDKQKKPLAGAAVTFNGQPVTTNARGQARLTNLRSGKETGTVTYRGQSTAVTINVQAQPDTSKGVQSVSLTAIRPTGLLKSLLPFIVVILLIALVLAWLFLPRNWRPTWMRNPAVFKKGPKATQPEVSASDFPAKSTEAYPLLTKFKPSRPDPSMIISPSAPKKSDVTTRRPDGSDHSGVDS